MLKWLVSARACDGATIKALSDLGPRISSPNKGRKSPKCRRGRGLEEVFHVAGWSS
jgi:hypothetical protein